MRWNMRQETRQRFNQMLEDGWTLRELAEAAELNYQWVKMYRKADGTGYDGAKEQAIYDLFEDYYE